MTRAEELAALRAKLDKRRDRPGFADNVKAIERRIAELGDEQGPTLNVVPINGGDDA